MHPRTLFAGLLFGAALVSTGANASYSTTTQGMAVVAPLNLKEISFQTAFAQTGNAIADADPQLDMSGQGKGVKVEEARAYGAASLSYVTDGVSLKVSQDETDVDSSHHVPLPSAIWLFGSALIGFVTMSNRRRV